MKSSKLLFLLFIILVLLSPTVSFAKMIQHNLRVNGLTCPFCFAASAKALRKFKKVYHIDFDLNEGLIKVCTDHTLKFHEEELSTLFLDKGFTYIGKKTIDNCQLNEK